MGGARHSPLALIRQLSVELTEACVGLQDEDLVLFEDLRLCALRPLEKIERRFCFELLSVQK